MAELRQRLNEGAAQFIVQGTSFPTRVLAFGGTFVVVEVLYELVLAGPAQRIAPWLGNHGHWFDRITGGTLAGIGAALIAAAR